MNEDKNEQTANPEPMNRRAFFQRAGLAAITVSVPSWVWGCGGGEPSTASSEGSAGGEAPAETSGSVAAGGDDGGGLGLQGTADGVTDEMRQQIATWEGEAVFTEAAPGPWEGKAGSHVPQVSFSEGHVELFTQHGMAPEHFIDAQYLKDQDGNLIGFAPHEGTDAEARATFALPEGTTEITAYSHCNRHGDWSAVPAAPSA